ncbi:hypothetical protein [Anaerotignum sp. MB30-C6]|uniref:hypothetical protein n=1 Tax=Anaerotignum sp. MB30-C6 TaxID=3070814 RepID=UPI0027DC0806|nr:hypothetical protein [Anaerotignum sp. MB30-C6]WMI81923.1 hypothetical protein RBQ60_04115 [Anaerotignum sp. MB30-C6]
MERVSDEALDILNELHTEHLAYQSEYLPLVECVNVCSEYEDTGITPDEINQLKAENAALKARLDKAVELPCKFGDTVYVLMQRNATTEVVKGTFKNVRRYDDDVWWVEFSDIWIDKTLDDFGKTVFLTKAEAQAKLDAMKGGAE